MSICFQIDSTPACFTSLSGERQQLLAVFQHDNAGQPAVRFVDSNGDIVPDADLTNTTLGLCPLPNATYEINRKSGPLTVRAPFRSVSFTSLCHDNTINGVPVPNSFTWGVSAEGAGDILNDVTFDGTDYILTVVI
jgi:hypothetical protein